jgi:serine phosphatase RsbU (regulator of sigma subunit)
LLLATDGATEAMDARQQLFGRQRLAAAWQAGRDLPVGEAVDHIGRALDEHVGASPAS